MSMQVHHVAQFDRDVSEEVTNWLKYLKGQVTSVQFLTTTVPDPKAAGGLAGPVRGLHHLPEVACRRALPHRSDFAPVFGGRAKS